MVRVSTSGSTNAPSASTGCNNVRGTGFVYRYHNGMAFRGVDYIHIDSQFSEQELMVRQTARRFVDERIMPVIRDCWREGRFPRDLIREMGALGFLGATIE